MARGGKRAGAGRKVGSISKATIAHAQVVAEERKAKGHKAGLEIMREVAAYFMGLAAKHQPTDEAKSARYAEKGGNFAAKITEYETPKLQSTTLRAEGGSDGASLKVEVEYI